MDSDFPVLGALGHVLPRQPGIVVTPISLALGEKNVPRTQITTRQKKSFLLLFFKKEALPS
jgi:hypothetical protein